MQQDGRSGIHARVIVLFLWWEDGVCEKGEGGLDKNRSRMGYEKGGGAQLGLLKVGGEIGGRRIEGMQILFDN